MSLVSWSCDTYNRSISDYRQFMVLRKVLFYEHTLMIVITNIINMTITVIVFVGTIITTVLISVPLGFSAGEDTKELGENIFPLL